MTFLLVAFTALTWWQMVLWVAYAIYFTCRAWHVWTEMNDYGIKKGYKYVIVGHSKDYRLYHLVRTILDIPPMLLGLVFPLLKKVLSFKLYTFKDEKK